MRIFKVAEYTRTLATSVGEVLVLGKGFMLNISIIVQIDKDRQDSHIGQYQTSPSIEHAHELYSNGC